jgi:hypothetical protein
MLSSGDSNLADSFKMTTLANDPVVCAAKLAFLIRLASDTFELVELKAIEP